MSRFTGGVGREEEDGLGWEFLVPTKEEKEEAKRYAAAKQRCLDEWQTVNDPPCHPSDKDWRPCPLCKTLNVGVTAVSDGRSCNCSQYRRGALTAGWRCPVHGQQW